MCRQDISSPAISARLRKDTRVSDRHTSKTSFDNADYDIDSRVTSQLESLDDIIFPAIDGDLSALEAASTAWKQAVATLGQTAIQESRREYLRHARATWVFLRNQTMQ